MDYRETPPHPALRPYVQCFWQLEGDAGVGEAERVLPDGRSEIVFNSGDIVHQYEPNETTVVQPRTIIVGAADRALLIRPTGRLDCFGIRFRRGGAAAMLRVDASELTNAVTDLAALGTLFDRSFGDQIATAPSFRARVQLVTGPLLDRIPGPSRVRVAVHALERSNGRADIARVARHVGLGTRQLERRFQQEVGLPPKTLARLVRFSGLVRHLAHAAPVPLARLAVERGYHDQAHLARDFREFAGRSAFAYLRETHRWSDHFFGSEE
jgi:AraC-like DNA-binding protein